jgi:translation initiation factor 1A
LGKRKILSESDIKPRLPPDFEVLGVAEKLLGYERVMVRCLDGFTRLCRIRGKMKRRIWVRLNSARTNQTAWLRSNGYLEEIDVSKGV